VVAAFPPPSKRVDRNKSGERNKIHTPHTAKRKAKRIFITLIYVFAYLKMIYFFEKKVYNVLERVKKE
jgi:hypothetical protein